MCMRHDPLWTVQDVATYLGVAVQTIYDWRLKEVGPPAFKVGRHLRYRERRHGVARQADLGGLRCRVSYWDWASGATSPLAATVGARAPTGLGLGIGAMTAVYVSLSAGEARNAVRADQWSKPSPN